MGIKQTLRNFLGEVIEEADMEPAQGVTSEAAARSYFEMCALSTAISYKANALTMSDIKVYEDGEPTHSTLWYRLNYQPNENENASQFWNRVMHKLIIDGEALVVTVRNNLYCADSFAPDYKPLGQDTYGTICIGEETLRQTFRASRVLHFKLEDDAVATYVNKALKSYSALMTRAIEDYKRSGTRYKMTLERRGTGDAAQQAAQQEAMRVNLKTFIENANSVYMETAGQHLEVLPGSSGESKEISDLRKEIYEMAAASLKVPQSVLYGNMTNLGEVVNVMLTFAVDPEAKMIAQELTRKSFTESQICDGARVVVDTSTVKHIDLLDAAASMMNLVSSGVATIDDILETLGREPERTAYTSQRWMTKNIGRIEDVLNGETSGGGDLSA